MHVELIADADCPNVPLARERLRVAFERVGAEPRWIERVRDPSADATLARWPSPTILVDGADVEGDAPGEGACCRVYRDASGVTSGAPSVERIAAALARARR